MQRIIILLLSLWVGVSFIPFPIQPAKKITRREGCFEADSLRAKIGSIVKESGITGLAVVIIKNNAVVWQHAFGFRNKKTHDSLSVNTAIWAASLTKPVFAYAFLELVSKGIFSLDQPLYTYLKNPSRTYERYRDLFSEENFKKITPRMILCHNSGFPLFRPLSSSAGFSPCEPGKNFCYSNEAMNLLGYTVEQYTGRSLDELVKKFVFDSLNMEHSSMKWEKEFETDYAVGHNHWGNTLSVSKRARPYAAGSLITTPADYARFVMALLQKKGLNETLYQDMFEPQVYIGSCRSYGSESSVSTGEYESIKLSWGLGLGLFDSPLGKAFFHPGHSEGWQHYFVAYPEKGIAVIFMSNSSNFEPAAGQLLDLCIGDVYSPLDWLGFNDRQ